MTSGGTFTSSSTGHNANKNGFNPSKHRTTAGIIVIGDEILKGSTHDSNSNFMCRRLHDRGVIVKKIAVVGDEIAEIAEQVKEFSEKFDIVFTTGGIGPTHDDRTFAGLAVAFDDELSTSDELKEVVEVFLRKTKLKNVDEAVEKFCKIPRTAKLLWGSTPPPKTTKEMSRFPSVQIRNVVSFPGVPRFCEQAFDQLEECLFPKASHQPFFSRTIFLRRNEVHLQNKVTQIAQNHAAGGVTIGSYPVMGNSYFKTQLIVESESVEAGEHAYKDLLKSFKEHVVNYDEEPWKDCVEKFRVFRSQQSPEFIDKLDDAMRVIDEIFEQYTLNEIALSFNGGKDCTVLLHLLKIKIEERFGAGVTFNGFHIQNVDEFSELRDFITDVAKKYGLEDRELSGSLKEGLEQLKRHRPDVVAVVMGSRASDPRGRFMKSKCEWTDQDWPRFYRVCPILDWSYADVWRILRGLCIPYCSLYDQGYTSLGDRDKTAPNPALRVPGDEERYRPAYLLEDGGLERLGRRETVPPS